MVTIQDIEGGQQLIVQPNRSANWQLNKLIILAFAIWWSAIAGFFAYRGLWPILPFAGIEVGGLALALYYVCWKLEQRHVVQFGDDALIVQKGAYYPRFTWRLERASTALSVEVQTHPWDPLCIFICNRDERIAIGNFLAKEDSEQLLKLLRAQGLRVRNYSELVKLDL
jgi:uncharacterized membrane protein